MVLPSLLLQVTLGFLGLFAIPSYAAQRRLDIPNESHSHWVGRAHRPQQKTDVSSSKPPAAESIFMGATSAETEEKDASKQQHWSSPSGAKSGDDVALFSFSEPSSGVMKLLEGVQASQLARPLSRDQSSSPKKNNAKLSAFDGVGGSSENASKEPFSADFSVRRDLAKLLLKDQFSADPSPNSRLKKAVETEGGHLSSVGLTMCGRREQDEDALVVDAALPNSPFLLKALFDGHGGLSTSKYCSENMHRFLSEPSPCLSAFLAVSGSASTPEALRDAFLALDEEILGATSTRQAGSTGIVALIEELEESRELLVAGREVIQSTCAVTLYQKLEEADKLGVSEGPLQLIKLGGPTAPGFLVTVANVGDSRATLLHADGTFTILSRDHKPTDFEELERIQRAGGFVSYSSSTVPRVDGILALSRAFGDGAFKATKKLGPTQQRVVAVPEVHTFYAKPGDVLMLACDGVFEPDAMNWLYVSHFMIELLYGHGDDLTEAGVKLLEHAYESLSGDNISVVLTRFHDGLRKERRSRRFEVTVNGACYVAP
ncbi:probable protein phosphatase 2C 21 [Cyclospora cayetanensis]|uniref:Probable protein phosphatase 2C 21 n=1 Tax=Cyclospora cayetanensis TaxID=88456 RepID=A0A6P6RYY8_9EIME|nr:probable protein phosphatase 2C 21 [Cyclospora cayetanensis]